MRVRRDDAEIPLGPRQQQLVLALLLARAGGLVPMDDLVELLWEGDAPPSAANAVHRQIGALRRLLEPGLRTREVGRYLLREQTGYRLRVEPVSFDLLRFRALIEQGRSRMATGDAAGALAAYSRGLELWRGRCAAGLGRHPAFAAIEGERALGVREAADAAVACEQTRTVLTPLRQVSDQYPLDESLQSRLLVALAADGRQAEAVARFHDVRRRLAEEIGLDPGRELRQAYDRVLHQQAAAPPSACSSGLPRPTQLPPDPPYFTGRETLLARAHAAATRPGGPRVLAVDGMPGVGKTTLAVHLAHQLAPGFPDGQLYVDLRGFQGQGTVMAPAEALRGFLHSLGVAAGAIPAELHAQAGLFRSLVADRRLLIVLDNCRDAEQVRHLLPASAACLVLVTSRVRLTALVAGHGAVRLPVGLPGAAEARELVEQRLGGRGSETDRIVALGGRLPLALAVVCARVADEPLDRIAATGLDELREAFSWSYRALSPGAQALLRTAGDDLAADRTAPALLRELRDAHLLTEHQPGRYRAHELVRAYLAES